MTEKTKKERIEELETALVSSMLESIRNDLDWADFIDVAKYILGEEVDEIIELEELISYVYGV